MKNLELSIDFADSYYKEMNYSNRNLTITVVLWNETIVQIVFLTAIRFKYMAGGEISDFYEDNIEDLLLLDSLKIYCRSDVPNNFNFKKFSVIDIDDFCIFEIVAENVVVTKKI